MTDTAVGAVDTSQADSDDEHGTRMARTQGEPSVHAHAVVKVAFQGQLHQ